jgi:small subunit ribosomal protein S13
MPSGRASLPGIQEDQFMVRIAGVDVPDRKRAHIALRSIYGVGPVIASEILEKAGIDPDMSPRMNELDEIQVDRIREIVDREYLTEGDLRREVNQNIRRLIEIGSYRGLRHRRGLPVNGQRTRTNARSRKGPRRTVAGRGRRTGGKK